MCKSKNGTHPAFSKTTTHTEDDTMYSNSSTILALPLVTLICSAMLLITVIHSSDGLVAYSGDAGETHLETVMARVLGQEATTNTSQHL